MLCVCRFIENGRTLYNYARTRKKKKKKKSRYNRRKKKKSQQWIIPIEDLLYSIAGYHWYGWKRHPSKKKKKNCITTDLNICFFFLLNSIEKVLYKSGIHHLIWPAKKICIWQICTFFLHEFRAKWKESSGTLVWGQLLYFLDLSLSHLFLFIFIYPCYITIIFFFCF